jgi:hypothetical protein
MMTFARIGNGASSAVIDQVPRFGICRRPLDNDGAQLPLIKRGRNGEVLPLVEALLACRNRLGLLSGHNNRRTGLL